MQLKRLIVVITTLVLLNLSSGARLVRQSNQLVDKCPDHHISTVHNTVNCACHIKEQLAAGTPKLLNICDSWKSDLLEKPCASFMRKGKVDLIAVGRAMANVHRDTFIWDTDEALHTEHGQNGVTWRQQEGLVKPKPFPGFPLPSPDPNNCIYHCQCCYMCGIPCYEPWCNCNRYLCRRTCRPLSYFCPLVA